MSIIAVVLLNHVRVEVPGESAFLPDCIFWVATGLHCSGCGATRLVHALLNGRIYEAFRYNPLLFIALPFLVLGAISEARRYLYGVTLFRQRLHPRVILGIFWLIVVYWVARNIPIFPFTELAPMSVA